QIFARREEDGTITYRLMDTFLDGEGGRQETINLWRSDADGNTLGTPLRLFPAVTRPAQTEGESNQIGLSNLLDSIGWESGNPFAYRTLQAGTPNITPGWRYNPLTRSLERLGQALPENNRLGLEGNRHAVSQSWRDVAVTGLVLSGEESSQRLNFTESDWSLLLGRSGFSRGMGLLSSVKSPFGADGELKTTSFSNGRSVFAQSNFRTPAGSLLSVMIPLPSSSRNVEPIASDELETHAVIRLADGSTLRIRSQQEFRQSAPFTYDIENGLYGGTAVRNEATGHSNTVIEWVRGDRTVREYFNVGPDGKLPAWQLASSVDEDGNVHTGGSPLMRALASTFGGPVMDVVPGTGLEDWMGLLSSYGVAAEASTRLVDGTQVSTHIEKQADGSLLARTGQGNNLYDRPYQATFRMDPTGRTLALQSDRNGGSVVTAMSLAQFWQSNGLAVRDRQTTASSDSLVLRRPDGSFQQTTYEKQDNGDVRAVTVLVDLEGHVTTLDVTFDSDGKVLRQNVADARWAGVQTGAGSETKTDELDSEGNKVQPKEPPPSPQAVAFGQLVGLKPVWPKSTAGSQLEISGKVDGDVQRSVVLRRETDGTVTAAVTDTAPDGTTRRLAYRLDDDANVLATVTDFGTPQAADLGSGFWNAVDVPATDNRSNTGSNNWITRNFSLQPASSRPPARGSYQSTVKNLPGGVKQNSQLVRGSDGQLRLLSTVTDVAGHTRSIFVDVPGALAASTKTVKQPTAETRSVTALRLLDNSTLTMESTRNANGTVQTELSWKTAAGDVETETVHFDADGKVVGDPTLVKKIAEALHVAAPASMGTGLGSEDWLDLLMTMGTSVESATQLKGGSVLHTMAHR
ncbi:MAG TPA: hypothetical protein PLN89_03570, partial [Elusimicrobiota bacterium]|nr:hypothetical protein [Elusimicrobiota bacterium]